MRMIGVDVGGTFTDAVCYDDATGELRWSKASSTPAGPAAGVLAALERSEVDLAQVDRFVHGVTIGTNALLERKGAEVWMITTRGFGDTLEIARTNRTTLYDIKTLKPAPLVPRYRVIEVDERMLADGSVETPLDLDQVAAAATRLAKLAPAALAVGFLNSYVNAEHENAAVDLLRRRLPGWFVCGSAEVLPEMREYERFNTAALNATIGPVMARYLGALAESLRGRGYRHAVFLMVSNGGIVTAERAARFPVQTVLSGPAGGVAASTHLGELLGIRNLITYDMGGTSTDVCLIDDLEIPVTTEQVIDGYPNRTPQIEIGTVGAGGGSLAWIDSGTMLKVGPQSSGADPGPACYGRGGTQPTVTDANLVLGRLSSRLKLAGTVPLHEDRARQAVDRVVAAMPGLDTEGAADGIVRIAVARMVSAIKEISVSRGHDPRDFVLIAYGGAGPMHAALIAEELEIGRVLVPPRPGNFSAFGALISDIRHDHVQSHRMELKSTTPAEIERSFVAIEMEAREAMLAEGMPADRIAMVRSCGMRYIGQSWDLIVRLPADLASMDALEAAFHAVHEHRFGYRSTDAVEIVSFRVTAIGTVDKPALPRCTVSGDVRDALRDERPVYFSGARLETPVYARDALPLDAAIDGPAIIEEMGSVTIVPPGWRAQVGKLAELNLTWERSR